MVALNLCFGNSVLTSLRKLCCLSNIFFEKLCDFLVKINLHFRSSQSSVYSTNPFDEDDDNDVMVVPGSGKRSHRKKRRAPPPPTQVTFRGFLAYMSS